jgi:hypothetical protein
MYLSSSFAGVSTDRVNTGDRGAIYLVEPSIGLSAASTVDGGLPVNPARAQADPVLRQDIDPLAPTTS